MREAFVYTSLGLRRCVCGCCFYCPEERMKKYFTKAELILWGSSVTLILLSFLIFDRVNYMTLVASLIGVTSLHAQHRKCFLRFGTAEAIQGNQTENLR